MTVTTPLEGDHMEPTAEECRVKIAALEQELESYRALLATVTKPCPRKKRRA